MKKITKRLVSVMLAFAIVLTGMVIPSDAKAATKGLYYGYGTYEDYVEAMGLGAGASKKEVTDLSPMTSGVNENGEFTYFTYAELATSMGFVIPTDCSKILVDAGGTTYVGYKSDGSKFIIVKSDGYNIWGYDKNGYDKWGYDIRNYYNQNKEDKNNINNNPTLLVKIVDDKGNEIDENNAIWHKNIKFKVVDVTVKTNDGETMVSKSHYKVDIIKSNTNKDGYGWYKITVKCDSSYENLSYSKTIKVVPPTDRYGLITVPTDSLKEFDIYLHCHNQKVNGVEYYAGKDAKYKKLYGKGKKTTKQLLSAGNPLIEIKNINNGKKVYLKYRTYANVNGKKIYSDWIYEVLKNGMT